MEIKSLWMGNKKTGHYICSSFVAKGMEKQWAETFRGNNKEIVVKENGTPLYSNPKGKCSIHAWIDGVFQTVRVN